MSGGAGMLRLYMGGGAGKTTAAAGLALRAASHGKQVRVLQLLKPVISPEFASLQDKFGVPVLLAHPNMPFFFQLDEAGKADYTVRTARTIPRFFTPQTGDFLLVADEMGGTLQNGMFAEDVLLTLLQALPESVHVALTGRDFPASVLAAADLISEIQNRRHPFDRGVAAVEGLEF